MAKKKRKIDILAERFGGKWKYNGKFSYTPFTCDDGRYVVFFSTGRCDDEYFRSPRSAKCVLYSEDGRCLDEFNYYYYDAPLLVRNGC